MSDDEQENINLLQKLAGLQNIIPLFDNNSAVTPKFFLESCDNIMTLKLLFFSHGWQFVKVQNQRRCFFAII